MCLPICGELPASKTHAERRFAWQPTRDLTQPSLGTLTISQGRKDLDFYSVDVESIGRGCHEVLFVNKDATAEVYAVTCDRSGTPRSCTCPGFQFGRKKGIVCKHVESVRLLISEDIVHLPPDIAPAAMVA